MEEGDRFDKSGREYWGFREELIGFLQRTRGLVEFCVFGRRTLGILQRNYRAGSGIYLRAGDRFDKSRREYWGFREGFVLLLHKVCCRKPKVRQPGRPPIHLGKFGLGNKLMQKVYKSLMKSPEF